MENMFAEEENSPGTTQGIVGEDVPTSNTDMDVYSEVERNFRAVSAPHPLSLSVFPVVRNLLMMLDDEDLERCRDVCKSWRAVAKPLSLVHFEIQLGRPNLKPDIDYEKDWILLKKWTRRLNRGRSFTEFETNFKDTLKTLEEEVERSQVSMSLTVDKHTHLMGPRVKRIISNFGHLIGDLEYFCTASLALNGFCKLLLEGLPNLGNLKFSALFFDEDCSSVEGDFNPDLPQNSHEHLKRIYLGRYTNCKFQSLGKIFKMAVNLEEIHDLPIWLVNSVEMAGKGSVLKSIAYDHKLIKSLRNIDEKGKLGGFPPNGMTVLSSFEKLAQLKPKLISFRLILMKTPFEEGTSIDMIKPFVYSILLSSAQSLRTFEFSSSKFYGFQNFPQLSGVKTLIFPKHGPSPGEFFSPESSAQEIFPNVNEIRIGLILRGNWISPNWVQNPHNASWGSQIKRLHVRSLPKCSIPSLQKLFPEIEDLEFTGSGVEIVENLPILVESWQRLKSMTVLVRRFNDDIFPCNQYAGKIRLDCAFRGFSKFLVARLRQDHVQGLILFDEKIQRYKSRLIIGKIKELEQLTKKINHDWDWRNDMKVFAKFTDVTYDVASNFFHISNWP